ncbi:MAG TPA: PD-(D/E)XK nuclease family protein, partial [Paludibacteraceae bacterium]|nr:PD-(D/E)XK nuclease family protein [Paludibacteraceae bacterium]
NGEIILQWENKPFVFIGFNALNACEKTLFSYLKNKNQADFYWDYEAAELRDENNPASRFYKENTQMFPSKFTLNSQQETLSDKKIELIAVPSLVGQAKQTYELLDKLYPSDTSDHEWIKTAVVLPNETLLTPLLYSLPPQIKKVNVTMGLPLNITPVQGLLEHIFELQRQMRITDNRYLFYHQTVSNLLNHQYITLLCGREAQEIQTTVIENNLIYVDADAFENDELLATIFTPQEDTKNFLTYLLQILVILQKKFQQISETSQSYQLEYNFTSQYYLTLRRLNEVIKENASAIEMSLDTLMRLICQITASLTIPFVGESLEGLQIMGVLETRGLDFDNLIITSFNEDFFPKKTIPNSFIPYNLRRGFGLPTIEHQEAIFSYNFYRLIHHAKHIFLLYDSRTEGLQKGEVSRFLYQLQYHYKVPFTTKNVLYDISFKNSPVLQIEKNASVLEKLKSFLNNQPENRALSASSINTYIDCPLQFYLTYVEGLKEADEVKETIEYDMFGTLFHSSMEFLYQPFKNKLVNSSDLDTILKDSAQIEIAIQKAFSEKYFNKREDYQNIKLEGNYLLVANVLKKYIIQLLKIDKFYTPFKYLGSEKEFQLEFPIQNGQEKVNLKGIIDRIDEKEGRLRIIDYKTGNGSLTFKNIEEVFAHEANNRPKYILQTFLYSMLYKYKSNTSLPIQPEIYYIKNLFKNDFTSQLTLKPNKEETIIIEDFNFYEEEFKTYLITCLEEIFNSAISFYQATNNKLCQYCPYQSICDR